MTTALSINLNKIALIRNSREGNFPNVIEYAQQCVEHNADGITVHPRPDQRHIRASDVYELSHFLQGLDRKTEGNSTPEFNIEGNPFAPACGSYPGFLQLVQDTRPEQATLVPDSDSQLTSDHGFDLHQSGDSLRPIIEQLHDQGIRVSLFMDPDIEQIHLAKTVGADRIELYTGPYAARFQQDLDSANTERWQTYCDAAQAAQALGLGVNAGHDLNLINLDRFLQIPNILEVSIGHAFTTDCLQLGLPEAMRRYTQICHK